MVTGLILICSLITPTCTVQTQTFETVRQCEQTNTDFMLNQNSKPNLPAYVVSSRCVNWGEPA